MNSTALQIEVAGSVFHLVCRRRERFCIGSAPDCKLSLDGDGIAEEHCEIERSGADRFVVTAIDGNEVAVNGLPPDEAGVETPFELALAGFVLRFELVPDESPETPDDAALEKESAPQKHALRHRLAATPDDSDALPLPVARPMRPPRPARVVEPSPDVLCPLPAERTRGVRPCRGSSRRAAIPALRFGPGRRRSDAAPRRPRTGDRATGSSTGTTRNRAPLPVSPVDGPRTGTVVVAIPMPGRDIGPAKRAPSPPKDAGPPRKVPAGLVVAMFVVLGLLLAGGTGWFAWRKFILPQRPGLLAEKIGQGDHTALATLGLSHLRGEWGAEFDFAKGRSMIEKAAEEGDPCGLLAVGLLCDEGFPMPGVSGGLHRSALALWRRALDAGALAVAVERDDPRWIALAVFAEWQVEGAVSDGTRRHLDRAVGAGYPNAALVALAMEQDEKARERLLLRAEKSARKAMRRGSVHAGALLGGLHAEQKFPGADPLYGRDLLRKAAEAGEPYAIVRLAPILAEEGEKREAFRLASLAAEAGSMNGKALAGRFLFEGTGTTRDAQEGFRLAKEAAEEGVVEGLAVVARAYAEGQGTGADPEEAVRIWRRLVEGGRTEFNAALGGQLADLGREAAAVEPLRAAALAGDMAAALRLGGILAGGASDDADRHAEGVSWLEKALKAEQPGAAVALAEVIDDPRRTRRDPARAVEILSRLADEGDQASAVRLAGYHLEGRGVEKNPTKALVILDKAAEAGEASAFFPLAELYESGTGEISKSPAMALECYRKAFGQHDPNLSKRFPGLDTGPGTVRDFLASWEADDHRRTLAWLDGKVSQYFHLDDPDVNAIASLEEGFRQLWSRRSVTVDEVEAVSLPALDRIEFRLKYRAGFGRGVWGGTAQATATAELVFPRDGGAPRLARFSETVEEWLLEPASDRFKLDGERATTRSVLPAVPVADSAYDYANLPRKDLESVKTMPFRDKFGGSHAMLPVSVGEGTVTFVRLPGGGELIVPEAHFEASALDRMGRLADGQSFAEFERWRSGLVLAPDRSDPATSALFRAAESGDHESEAMLGEAYYHGMGTFPVNRVEALKWFVRSARAKHPLGRVWIATMTQAGEIASNEPPRQQFRELLYDLASTISQPGAKGAYWRATAECYAAGEAIDFDVRQPRELLERAIATGDLRAYFLLGRHYARSGRTEGVRMLRYAADSRCASAATELAKHYLGPGSDPRLVPKLLRMAADKGDTEAQMLLGHFLAAGGEGEGRELEAAFWLELALRNAVALNDKQREVAIRETVRQSAVRIDEDLYRRVRSFFDKNSSVVKISP